MKRNENRIALLGAQLLAWHDGLAQPAIDNTEQALLWLRQVAHLCRGDGEERDSAADEPDALRATVAELQAELAACKATINDLSQAATPVSVSFAHPDVRQLEALGAAKPERQRTRCPHCEKIVAKSAPRIEREGDVWHAECWAQLSPATQAAHEAEPEQADVPPEPVPVDVPAEAPTFEDRPDWTAPAEPVEGADDVACPPSNPAPVVAQELPGYFDQPDPPKMPAAPVDEWPQFAHLRPTMREWAIKRELAKRGQG